MTDFYMAQPPPFCAACCEYRVRDHGAYFCEVCVATPHPKLPGPPSRMALDRPISTTSGDL